MDFMLISIFVVTVLVAFFPFLKKYKARWVFVNAVNKIPGPHSYPILGTTLPYIMMPREGSVRFYYCSTFAFMLSCSH